MESIILNKFFEEQHRHWKKRVYAVYQFTCGTFTVHSNYSGWLKHKNETTIRQAEHGQKNSFHQD